MRVPFMVVVRIRRGGSIVLPKNIREEAGIEEGDAVGGLC